jgi:histidyl-tRNA synthetase
MDFNDRSMKAQMKAASARNARLACILGEDELTRGTVAVKDLTTGEQKEIAGEGLAQAVKEMLSTLKG